MLSNEQDPGAQDTLAADLDDLTGFGAPGEDFGSGSAPADATAAPAADPAGAPQADTAGAAPRDPQAAEPSPADADGEPSTTPAFDPAILDQLQPFNYRVGTESRPVEGVMVLPSGEGAIIDADALPALEQRLAERDQLEAFARQQYDAHQTLTRLAAWTQTGPDGKEQTLTGAPALEAMQVASAANTAVLATMLQLFQQPARLAAFLQATQYEADGVTPKWELRQDAVRALASELKAARLEAAMGARERFQGLAQPPAPRGPALPEPPQYPALVQDYAKNNQITGLTPDDVTFLAQQLPSYLRQATAEDARQNPQLQPGQLVYDGRFLALVRDRATGAQSRAQQVQQASKVAQDNAQRMRQANLNGKSAAKPAATPQTAPNSRAARSRALWDFLEGSGAVGA